MQLDCYIVLMRMNAEQRRNLNYSMWRAQYNAVTEVHMHTDKGGLSYTLPFPAFKGGIQSAPYSECEKILIHWCIHLTILLFILVYLWIIIHYEQSAQYLGKPYNELKQDYVRSALQEKWSYMNQDQFDISSIDGSTFKGRTDY